MYIKTLKVKLIAKTSALGKIGISLFKIMDTATSSLKLFSTLLCTRTNSNNVTGLDETEHQIIIMMMIGSFNN